MLRRSVGRCLSHTIVRAWLVGALLIFPTIVAPAAADPQLCQSGRIVFSRFSQTGPDIYSMNACGQLVRRLTFHGGHQAKLSPNGRLIAFSASGSGVHTSDLWIMHTDGSGLRDLTNTPDRNDVDPAWSPDGRNIAWSSGPDGSRAGQLFVMSLCTGVSRAITQPFRPPRAWRRELVARRPRDRLRRVPGTARTRTAVCRRQQRPQPASNHPARPRRIRP